MTEEQKPTSVHLLARDGLSTLLVQQSASGGIELRAGEAIGNGEWRHVEGDLTIDRVYELHAFLGQIIYKYEGGERRWLKADIATLKKMLARLGEEQILERIGLEHRLKESQARLAELAQGVSAKTSLAQSKQTELTYEQRAQVAAKEVPADAWRCLSMHDPAHRRGVWYAEHDNMLFVCGGREGDDALAVIPKLRLTREESSALVEVLSYGAWMVDENVETKRPLYPSYCWDQLKQGEKEDEMKEEAENEFKEFPLSDKLLAACIKEANFNKSGKSQEDLLHEAQAFFSAWWRYVGGNMQRFLDLSPSQDTCLDLVVPNYNDDNITSGDAIYWLHAWQDVLLKHGRETIFKGSTVAVERNALGQLVLRGGRGGEKFTVAQDSASEVVYALKALLAAMTGREVMLVHPDTGEPQEQE